MGVPVQARIAECMRGVESYLQESGLEARVREWRNRSVLVYPNPRSQPTRFGLPRYTIPDTRIPYGAVWYSQKRGISAWATLGTDLKYGTTVTPRDVRY